MNKIASLVSKSNFYRLILYVFGWGKFMIGGDEDNVS